MDLHLEKVSKITSASLTSAIGCHKKAEKQNYVYYLLDEEF